MAVALKVRADDGNERRSFTFTTAFRIGRTEDCEVCIKNEHVSRKHAEVVVENGAWLIRDLHSANGLFVNGERVQSVPVFTSVKVRLGVYGPFVEFELPPQAPVSVFSSPHSMSPSVVPSVAKDKSHYLGDPNDQSIGEHTRMIRRVVAEVQTKQKRRYRGVIAALLVCALAIAAYAYYLHEDARKNKARAEAMFYAMKAIDVEIADVQRKVEASGDAQAKSQVATMQGQRKSLEDIYQHMLASLKVDQNLTEEQKLVFRVARIFGECELDMPKNFYNEVQKYIGYWKSTGKYREYIKRAQQKGYVKPIEQEFIAQGLPPQFFYLAMRESGFDEYAIGPATYMGYAKGMWQFIPKTALDYGLTLGPLANLNRIDVADDRLHWDRETKAAASYIKFLYSTDAQASGLLVMACYNWGEKSVLPLVQTMPDNPRDRNFWKLLELHRDKIPGETYQYVFYIVAAAVIGEEPRLFGMDFDNPLS